VSKPTHLNSETSGFGCVGFFCFSVNWAIAHDNGGSVMLVLSRKSSESVVIGDPGGCLEQLHKVTVLEIGRGKVRLGFEVANDVAVNRWEVWQRIRSRARPEGPPIGLSPPVGR
jgi:carbon storage regulator CsrA